MKSPLLDENFKNWFGDSKVIEPVDPALRREGIEYESRLFGGTYSDARLNSTGTARDAPIRKMIIAARKRYNAIRRELGLPAVAHWTSLPDALVQRFNGKPRVVYHGTAIKKDSFRREGGCAGVGAYFTIDKAVAKDFALMDASADGGRPIVMAVYLSIRNPLITEFVFDKNSYDKDSDPQAVTEPFRARLESEGHDGIFIKNTGEYVAFRPEQIKSVSNSGLWDPESASLTDHPEQREAERPRGPRG